MSGTTNVSPKPDSGQSPDGTSAGGAPRSSAVMIWVAVLMIVSGVFIMWMGIKYLRGGSSGSIAIVDTSYRTPPENSKEPWLKEFTLTERSGKTVSSKQLEGQPYVTSFFFASCPGYCMQQNQKVAGVAAEYGPKGVKFISISVDPENDTPAVLREYAHRLKADEENWLFLTGDQRYIARIGAEMFSVVAEKLTHSEKLVVSDKWGNIRGRYYWNNPAEMAEMRTMLDTLLAETEEPDEFKNQPDPMVATGDTAETAERAEEALGSASAASNAEANDSTGEQR